MPDKPHNHEPTREETERLLRSLPAPEALQPAAIDEILARMKTARAERDSSEEHQTITPLRPQPRRGRASWRRRQTPLIAAASTFAVVILAIFAISTSKLATGGYPSGSPPAGSTGTGTGSGGSWFGNRPNGDSGFGGSGILGIVGKGAVAGGLPSLSATVRRIASSLTSSGYRTSLPDPRKRGIEVLCGSGQPAKAAAHINAIKEPRPDKAVAMIFIFRDARVVQRCAPQVQLAVAKLSDATQVTPGIVRQNGRYYVISGSGRTLGVAMAFNRHAASLAAHDLYLAISAANG